MNNVVRKEIRRIIDMIGQLEKVCSSTERSFLMNARIELFQADYLDFRLNLKKRYIVPKTDFKYEC